MPTQTLINGQPTIALTAMETERLAEMLDCLSSEALALANVLTAPQIQIVRACILDWDEVGDDGTMIDGGRDALDYDPQRNRRIIREILLRIAGSYAKSNGLTFTAASSLGSSGGTLSGLFTVASPGSTCLGSW